MADYFVDATATGANNGSSPADAWVFIGSANATMVRGDNLWVRNTHIESGLQINSAFFGPNLNTRDTPGITRIIGWPQPNYPWYEVRPAAGVSAGWDTDLGVGAAASLGLLMPTFCFSYSLPTAGPLIGGGAQIFNMAFQSLNAVLPGPARSGAAGAGDKYSVLMDNVAILGNNTGLGRIGALPGNSAFANVNFGKLTICVSAANGSFGHIQGGTSAPIDVKHLVIHSMSVSSGAIFDANGGGTGRIGILQIDSNSINQWGGTSTGVINNDRQSGIGWQLWVGATRGKKPFNGFVAASNLSAFWSFRVDDFYGDGPYLIRQGGFLTRVASINEAAYAGANAAFTQVSTRNAPGNFSALFNSQDTLHWPIITKKFDVTTAGLAIHVPVYTSGSVAASLFNGAHGTLFTGVLGNPTVHANTTNVVAGSLTQWTGSLIAAGSAYEFVAVFTPTENLTGVNFEFYQPWWMTVTSGAFPTSFGTLLVGEPYKV